MTAPTLDGFRFTDPTFHADPYPRWAALRAEAPVWRFEEVGGWLVVGHDEVREVLGAADRFSLSRLDAGHPGVVAAADGPLARVERAGLFHVSTDDHRRLRRLVNPTFSAGNVERLRQRIVEIVDARLDAVDGRDRIDLVTDVIDGFAQEVVAELIGLSDVDRGWFASVSAPILALTDPLLDDERRAAAAAALGELETFIAAELDRQRRDGNGLLAELAAAADDGDRLNGDELFALVVVLLLGGTETVTDMLGLGFRTLLQHPDVVDGLRANPALWPNAFEELLRLSYIGVGITRFVRDDTTVAGADMTQGQLCFVAVGSALRDERFCDDPDRFDVTRPTRSSSLIFGTGAHHCLGAHLARIEGVEMFSAVTRRWPDMSPAGDVTFDDSLLLRGLRHLPVTLR